ncbi:MAG: tRNA (guanosine(37)-N1)-methyltransferase TrmD [Patescibacteria group bacterium]
MKITILTLFPKMFEGFLTESIVGRAQKNGFVEINFVNLRDFAKDTYGTVDDRPYGGGAGMVLRVDIIYEALKKVLGEDCLVPFDKSSKTRKERKTKIILTSAKGATYSQAKAEKYAQKYEHLIIIAGHYEGVDERVMRFVDDEISIGQYVLTGGEMPAAIIADSVVRLLPGVLKKDDAARKESYSLVDSEQRAESREQRKTKKERRREHPHYTRPIEFMGMEVPDVLLSGDHKKIEDWRKTN